MRLKDKYDTWVYEHDLDELREIYVQDLQLNRHRLERASAEQQTLFEKWYSAMEDVEGDIRDCMGSLARLRARINLSVRIANPDLKEAGVAAEVEIRKSVIQKTKELNNLRRYHGRLKGAVEAARQRKSMINALKDLYVSNYWDKAETSSKPRRRYG
jgi:hypothetical protein